MCHEHRDDQVKCGSLSTGSARLGIAFHIPTLAVGLFVCYRALPACGTSRRFQVSAVRWSAAALCRSDARSLTPLRLRARRAMASVGCSKEAHHVSEEA